MADQDLHMLVSHPPLMALSLGLDTPLPIGKQGGFAAVFGNTIHYLAGGGMGPSAHPEMAQCWSLPVDGSGSLNKNAWTQLASIPTPVVLTCGAVVGARAYVLGGLGPARTGFTNLVQIYDFAADRWSHGAAMPTALVAGGAAAVNGRIYMVGGSRLQGTGAGPGPVVQVYDVASNSWSQGPDLPESTYQNGCASIGSSVYSVGGTGGDFVLDTTTRRWTPIAPFPGRSRGKDAITQVAVTAYKHFLLVFGGIQNFSHPIASSWYFDTKTGQWGALTALAQARGVGSVAVIGENNPLGLAYFIGGVPAHVNRQAFPTVEAIGLKAIAVLSSSTAATCAVPPEAEPADAPVRLSGIGDPPASDTAAPENLVRTFNKKSAGLADDAFGGWIDYVQGVSSSARQPLIESGTSFSFRDGAEIRAGFSLKGPNLVSATGFQVSLSFNAPAVTPAPHLRLDCAFDGGATSSFDLELIPGGQWNQTKHWVSTAPINSACRLSLSYAATAADQPLSIDNIGIDVYGAYSSEAFLGRKYDEVCWLCSHNAFANVADGWRWAQQTDTVTHQLVGGVRAFMLDIYHQNGDIYLLHDGWLASRVMRPGFSDFRRLSETLTEINTYLDANPEEVVTLFFESGVTTAAGYALLNRAFDTAGTPESNLAHKLFRYDRANAGRNGATWDVDSQGAPTLKWMVENKLRCVVFSCYRGGDQFSVGRTAPDGWPMMWHYVRESVYNDSTCIDPGLWTEQRAESSDAETRNPRRTLNLVNHFPSWAVGAILPASLSFNSINDGKFIDQHLNAWTARFGRLPNFVAVDYYDVGKSGGAKLSVLNCGRRWANSDLRPDPPSFRTLVTNGNTLEQVKGDLKASRGIRSPVAISLVNLSDSDFTVLRGHQRHGKAVCDFPPLVVGANSDQAQVLNASGGQMCAGVSTTAMGMIGPQSFWLLQADGCDELLFVGVSSPYALLWYNNYANARWVAKTDAINRFLASGDGGDDLFDALFQEHNDGTYTNAPARLRARPWICSTWAMANDKIGDMTVTIWTY